MKKHVVAAALSLVLALQPAALLAQECLPEVQSATDTVRQTYIQGMSGLANNNFSQRPGTMSSMACLDKFMQGSMDIFFKPPQLNDLLSQVLNFACQKATQAVSNAVGGGGGGNVQGLLNGLVGGLSGGGSNLGQALGGGYSGGGTQVNSLNSLFGSRR